MFTGSTGATAGPTGSEGSAALRRGGDRLAGEERQVDPCAELVHGSSHAGTLQRTGQGGKLLVGGQYLGGGQVPAGQGGGAGVLIPLLDPGVAAGALLALAGGRRVGGQDCMAGGGTQLPRGLAGSVTENPLFNDGSMVVAEADGLVGDDTGLVAVDPSGGQRGHRGGHATQRDGEIEQGIGGPSGQRQGGGDLITDVLAGRAGPASLRIGLTAGGEICHGGELQGSRP
jgi:hypothetical protein